MLKSGRRDVLVVHAVVLEGSAHGLHGRRRAVARSAHRRLRRLHAQLEQSHVGDDRDLARAGHGDTGLIRARQRDVRLGRTTDHAEQHHHASGCYEYARALHRYAPVRAARRRAIHCHSVTIVSTVKCE